MLNSEPKITVLMPAYNAGKFIHEAIKSVLAQSFKDFELLIVNDGSTDDTINVIRSFTDDRIVLYNQGNKGVAAALNRGLKIARAPYIARFDADDICYPDRLEKQFNFLTAHPEYDIIGSAADYIDVTGQFIFTQHPAGHLNEELQELKYTTCPFIHSTVFYKKDLINSNGGYNENAYSFEDHFLWVNILAEKKACNLSQPLIKVRLNPESLTIDEKWRTKEFREIKYNALSRKQITSIEGSKLAAIGKSQHSKKIKEGAYYALCGKKFLVNNFQPQVARAHVLKAISLHPTRLDNYLLYLVSFLPESFVNRLHNLMPHNPARV